MAQEKPKKSRARIWIGLVVIVLIALLWVRQAGRSRLLAALGSDDLAVRTEAARTLLEKRILADSLATQPVGRRSKTAAVLPQIRTPRAIDLLVVLLADQENRPQRRAVSSLVKIGPDVIPYVAPLLATGTNRSKPAAIEVLSRIGAPSIPALRVALTDAASRPAAAQALAEIGSKGLPVAYEILLIGAKSNDNEMKNSCIPVLGEKQNRDAVEPALAGLGTAALNLNCIRALGRIGDARATEKILPFLKDPLLRSDAARALGGIADPRAIPHLLPALGDQEQGYRDAAILAFRRIGPPAVPALAGQLKSANVQIRRSAAQAMLRIDSPAMVAPLAAALKDPDSLVRLAAAGALGWPGNAAAVAPLIGAFNDPDYRVADAAIAGLARIGAPAIEPLLAKFSSPNPSEAYYASRALVSMGKPALPRLTALAENGQQIQARKWATITLGETGDPDAADVLKKLQKVASGDFRWVVDQQLTKFSS